MSSFKFQTSDQIIIICNLEDCSLPSWSDTFESGLDWSLGAFLAVSFMNQTLKSWQFWNDKTQNLEKIFSLDKTASLGWMEELFGEYPMSCRSWISYHHLFQCFVGAKNIHSHINFMLLSLIEEIFISQSFNYKNVKKNTMTVRWFGPFNVADRQMITEARSDGICVSLRRDDNVISK